MGHLLRWFAIISVTYPMLTGGATAQMSCPEAFAKLQNYVASVNQAAALEYYQGIGVRCQQDLTCARIAVQQLNAWYSSQEEQVRGWYAEINKECRLKNSSPNANPNINENDDLGHDIDGERSVRIRIPDQPSFPVASTNQDYVVRRVYFGTDREISSNLAGSAVFGTRWTKRISFGEVYVGIPRDHRLGQLETHSLWSLQFEDDPAKHVTVLKSSVLSKQKFFESMRTSVRSSPKKDLLLFVHGFNVSFVDAARRTAQMAYDLGFRGAAAFFSWPSHGQLIGYGMDEQAIIDAEPHLEAFLKDLLNHSDADNIYLIAHSMGNRGLTRALIALAVADREQTKRIKQIILAAPDIGANEFIEQIAPALGKLGAPITLYASSNDRALAASKKFHGGQRAGESGDKIIVVSGVETIDASNTDTDLIGHSYYGDRRSVLADMWYLINEDMPAARRCCLEGRPSQTEPKYWMFLK